MVERVGSLDCKTCGLRLVDATEDEIQYHIGECGTCAQAHASDGRSSDGGVMDKWWPHVFEPKKYSERVKTYQEDYEVRHPDPELRSDDMAYRVPAIPPEERRLRDIEHELVELRRLYAFSRRASIATITGVLVFLTVIYLIVHLP